MRQLPIVGLLLSAACGPNITLPGPSSGSLPGLGSTVLDGGSDSGTFLPSESEGSDGGAEDGGKKTVGADAGGQGSDAGGCQLLGPFFPDADGDGYGAKASPGVFACAQPNGYVTNNLDCADGDDRARPNQTTPQTQAAIGLTSGPPFDFNCDGIETKQWTAWGLCNMADTCLGAGSSNHWLGDTVPKCGETRTWILSCSSRCIPTSIQKTQECL
jgi:hypothetical protein